MELSLKERCICSECICGLGKVTSVGVVLETVSRYYLMLNQRFGLQRVFRWAMPGVGGGEYVLEAAL